MAQPIINFPFSKGLKLKFDNSPNSLQKQASPISTGQSPNIILSLNKTASEEVIKRINVVRLMF